MLVGHKQERQLLHCSRLQQEPVVVGAGLPACSQQLRLVLLSVEQTRQRPKDQGLHEEAGVVGRDVVHVLHVLQGFKDAASARAGNRRKPNNPARVV